jgi:uncharacterized protein YdeI (YjbR/CyaY-like superfamily)
MISIQDQENKEKIKVYDDLNTKLWGMVDIFTYYFDKLNPDEKYNLMVALSETKKELEAEGEI